MAITPPPNPPTGLSATVVSTSQIELDWNHDGKNLSEFRIERSLNETSGFTVIATVYPGTTAYSDSGLDADTTYFYRVRAHNGRKSAISAVVSATTEAQPAPTAPTNFGAEALSVSQIDLSWDHDGANVDEFLVERSLSGASGFSVIATVGSVATAYSDSGLDADTTYFYRVEARNANGSATSSVVSATTAASGDGLAPYDGPWTAAEAGHLLRRATFGPSSRMIDESVQLGLEGTMDQLFAERPAPDHPVKYLPDGEYGDPLTLYDPDVSQGETWVDAPPFPDPALVPGNLERNRILRARQKSLDGWMFLLMHEGTLSIREKMVIFWHNHFVVSDFTLAQRAYDYVATLRSHALGNFRELTMDMTVDSGMLLWLNGAQNTNEAPNENYAREVLELFTVGKGALAAPGDYSTFTEDDVIEMAKVFTGWRVPLSQESMRTGATLVPYFDPSKHTGGDKTLSHRFNRAVIAEAGENEYRNLIDVIFQSDACSLFVSRELYRWFVHYDIDDQVEAQVIEPMARIIRDNDYDIAPAVRTLLSSWHFFSHKGCMIKSPVDLMLSLTQGLSVEIPAGDLKEEYEYGVMLHKLSEELGMGIFDHLHVGGWSAWYQEPQYYRFWLNNLTYPKRNDYAATFVYGGTQETVSETFRVGDIIPVLDFLTTVEHAGDANTLVDRATQLAFPRPVSQEQKAYLKVALIPELDDAAWTTDYERYLENPTNSRRRNAVRNRLRELFAAMIQMPEFQLM